MMDRSYLRMSGCISGCIVSFTLLAALLLPHPAAAEGEQLRGPAFSDPDVVHIPDSEWADKPVKYTEKDAGADLVIDMNQQLYPFLQPLIRDFAARENITVEVSEGTCGKSAGRLNRKEVDIGSFCCPPGKLDRLPGLQFHTLGISPMAILVHADNPVESITLEEARNIFQGKISDWRSVGGPEGPIKMIASLHCGKRPGHWRLLLDNQDLFSSRFIEIGDMPDQIRLISSTPEAIGYETLWVAAQFREKGIVKGLGISGLHPSDLRHLEAGTYPIYRVFNVTTWEDTRHANSLAAKLVDYLMVKVEELDPKYGLVAADRLRESGWKFQGDELVGEPE